MGGDGALCRRYGRTQGTERKQGTESFVKGQRALSRDRESFVAVPTRDRESFVAVATVGNNVKKEEEEGGGGGGGGKFIQS